MYSHAERYRAAHSPSGRVDRENRVIYGVAIVEKGPVRFDARKQFADDETLRQVHALGRAAADGIKSHLSHGDDLTDGIFNHLGRFRSFRIAGEAVVADLHVAASAKDGDYILNLAAEDPKAFGASMQTLLDRNAPRRADGFQAIRVLELYAVDLVGTPALTGGLLAAQFAAQNGPTPPSKPATHLDVVADYLANHGMYAEDGETLLDRVEAFYDAPGAPEPTDAILEAVKRQSDELQERWLGGGVENPYGRKVPVKNGL